MLKLIFAWRRPVWAKGARNKALNLRKHIAEAIDPKEEKRKTKERETEESRMSIEAEGRSKVQKPLDEIEKREEEQKRKDK